MKQKLAILVILAAILACAKYDPSNYSGIWATSTPMPTVSPFPSPTATMRPSPMPTITLTALPTDASIELCVVAVENVYLRPSPDATYYPLLPLPRGTRVLDLGSRDRNWVFVQYQDKKGWINSAYLGGCN